MKTRCDVTPGTDFLPAGLRRGIHEQSTETTEVVPTSGLSSSTVPIAQSGSEKAKRLPDLCSVDRSWGCTYPTPDSSQTPT